MKCKVSIIREGRGYYMKRKLVVVEEAGFLPELGVNGPLEYPSWVRLDAVAQLAKNNRNVFACDPEDPSNKNARIRVTPENVTKDFKDMISEKVPEDPDGEKDQEDSNGGKDPEWKLMNDQITDFPPIQRSGFINKEPVEKENIPQVIAPNPLEKKEETVPPAQEPTNQDKNNTVPKVIQDETPKEEKKENIPQKPAENQKKNDYQQKNKGKHGKGNK